MVGLAKFFDLRDALVIVEPETFVGWHRTAFKSFGDENRANPAVRRSRKTSETWCSPHRHKLPDGDRATSTPDLGGLHHEYWLEKKAA
jgi:hypothetical protein